MAGKVLRYAQLGGSLGAFIGGVHRRALAIEETAELVAGCFDPRPANNKETAEYYGIAEDRTYADYKEMIEKETQREDKIDFVSICTPNFLHYEMAKACLEAGFHVACEKPLCFEVGQAEELQKIAKEKNLFFAVTYTYTGYAMVKFAKELVEKGEIGEVIDVNAEYLQDWLLDDAYKVEEGGEHVHSIWRKDPKMSGGSNCVGDIGTHIEAVITYVTGLKTKKVCAVLDNYGQTLDLNANILVELENGCHGIFSCSQIAAGHYNGLVFRIFGTKGAIEWVQENPEFLKVTLKGEPTRVYARGSFGVDGLAAQRQHVPGGHPEGLTMAFANIYRAFQDAIIAQKNGKEPSVADLDFVNVDYGVEGVKFIQACLKSTQNGSTWVEL